MVLPWAGSLNTFDPAPCERGDAPMPTLSPVVDSHTETESSSFGDLTLNREDCLEDTNTAEVGRV